MALVLKVFMSFSLEHLLIVELKILDILQIRFIRKDLVVVLRILSEMELRGETESLFSADWRTRVFNWGIRVEWKPWNERNIHRIDGGKGKSGLAWTGKWTQKRMSPNCCSFRILLGADSREQLQAWLVALNETLSSIRAWINSPLCSLNFRGSYDLNNDSDV